MIEIHTLFEIELFNFSALFATNKEMLHLKTYCHYAV